MNPPPLPEHEDEAAGDAGSAARNPAPAAPLGEGPRTITSAELLRGGRELRIAHGDEVYRLLLTRTGKLLLQK